MDPKWIYQIDFIDMGVKNIIDKIRRNWFNSYTIERILTLKSVPDFSY